VINLNNGTKVVRSRFNLESRKLALGGEELHSDSQEVD